MLFCPSDVMNRSRIREELVANRAFLDELVESVNGGSTYSNSTYPPMSNDIHCMYMDSYFDQGNLVFAGRAFREDTFVTDPESWDRFMGLLQMLDTLLLHEINQYLQAKGISFQEMMNQFSLEPDEVFSHTTFGGNEKLLITKLIAGRGPCYHVRSKARRAEGEMRLLGYTLARKWHAPDSICHWYMNRDVVAFGDTSTEYMPEPTYSVTAPGSYHIQLVPSIFKRVSTSEAPCSDTITPREHDECLADGKCDYMLWL
jgi:hypothetical protein